MAEGLRRTQSGPDSIPYVVAVIGDGALTGGLAFEGLNNLAARPGRRLVIVLNDNGRSYAPTVGALAAHLAGRRPGSEDPVLCEVPPLARACHSQPANTTVLALALPTAFQPHGTRTSLLAQAGLDAAGIYRWVTNALHTATHTPNPTSTERSLTS